MSEVWEECPNCGQHIPLHGEQFVTCDCGAAYVVDYEVRLTRITEIQQQSGAPPGAERGGK